MAFPSILRHLFAAGYLCQTIFVSSVFAANGELHWNAVLPNSPSGFTIDGRRADTNGGEWFTMNSSDVVQFDSGTTVGYRLTSDYSNVVVLRSEEWDDPITASSFSKSSMLMRNELAIGGVSFTESVNPNATSEDIWNSTAPFTNIPLSIRYVVSNEKCEDRVITVSTLDGNGVANNVTAINTLSGTVGSALPIQLNVTYLEDPTFYITVRYNPTNSIQYLLGDGSVEPYVPEAVITTTFLLCL